MNHNKGVDKMAKDLVCGMEVSESGLKSTAEGKTFYFCSPACKQNFEANPSKFLKK